MENNENEFSLGAVGATVTALNTAGANGPTGPKETKEVNMSFKIDKIEIDQNSYYSKKIIDPVLFKYDERKYVNEIYDYILKTYGQHYSQNKFQATEFIIDSGHGTGFCMGNVMKYTQRYGKKGTRDDWRKDLIKVIHYAMMQLYVHDNEGTK
jgi:hypothetical protein